MFLNVDNQVLLANTTAQPGSLMHRLVQATGGIGLNVNADKTVHVFQTRRNHFHFKWLASKINWQVYIPR